MTNHWKKTAVSALSALMITALCGCSGSAAVEVTADNKADAKKLVDEFYNGLADANPVEMSSAQNGEVPSIFTRDGSKLRYEDKTNGYLFYLFEENGKKYFLSSDMKEPTEEEYTYDLYDNTIEMTLTYMINAYFQDELEEEGLTYAASRKDVTADGKTESELTTSVSAVQDGIKAEITSVGKKTDDKVTNITFTMTQGNETVTRELNFNYEGISIELPEYEIFDISEYYEHVESPFKTFADAKEAVREDLYYVTYDNLAVAVVHTDGKLYQLSAQMDADTFEKYNALDSDAEDYTEQVNSLIDPLAVTDCVDFTALAIDQKTLDAYAGKKIGDLIDEGFSHNGYGISDEGSYVYLDKNDIVYEFEVTLPEGFDTDKDFEFEDLYDCVIKKASYHDTNTSLLPLK